MGGNSRQRKSSSRFFSISSMFKSKKKIGGYYDDACDEGMKGRRMWPSDEDKGHWGVAEPGIDVKAGAFIAHFKKRVSETERFQLHSTAGDLH